VSVEQQKDNQPRTCMPSNRPAPKLFPLLRHSSLKSPLENPSRLYQHPTLLLLPRLPTRLCTETAQTNTTDYALAPPPPTLHLPAVNITQHPRTIPIDAFIARSTARAGSALRESRYWCHSHSAINVITRRDKSKGEVETRGR